ncbi:MAG: hypothetical protein HKN76_07905 [Saprospiraceae bacterium]|nr:hypothetical protein [Saprospiraceae bacterium]
MTQRQEKTAIDNYYFPPYGYLGLLLVIVFWYLNWHLEGLRSHWGFFPLWLGYILCVNGLTHRFKGSSMFIRDLRGWGLLFILSAPVWWLFEWLNQVAGYWQYLGIESFSDWEYNIYCTINFSIVIPAIFSTTELVTVFYSKQPYVKKVKFGGSKITQVLLFLIGLTMLLSFFIWPEYSAALLWMSLFLILDPLNFWLGYPSILSQTAKGNWCLVAALWMGGLLCGLFWELWNYYSWPKWIYNVPGVNFWHVFEMPLIGYLGYLPFALELYAMYHFILGILRLKSSLGFNCD